MSDGDQIQTFMDRAEWQREMRIPVVSSPKRSEVGSLLPCPQPRLCAAHWHAGLTEIARQGHHGKSNVHFRRGRVSREGLEGEVPRKRHQGVRALQEDYRSTSLNSTFLLQRKEIQGRRGLEPDAPGVNRSFSCSA